MVIPDVWIKYPWDAEDIDLHEAYERAMLAAREKEAAR